MQRHQAQVDGLDADERDDDAAHAVDQQVVAQQHIGGLGLVLHALQRQRNQRDDDDGVEDDRGENGRLRRMQVHDVERVEHREHAQRTWPE